MKVTRAKLGVGDGENGLPVSYRSPLAELGRYKDARQEDRAGTHKIEWMLKPTEKASASV